MFCRLLERYIFKEILQVFLFSLFVLLLILFIIFSGKIVHKYGQYVSIADIFLLAPYTLGLSASLTIPLAMLAATTMVYGRMSHDREILIMRIAGVHFYRMFRPAFFLGLLLSGICFYINANVVPNTYIKQLKLREKSLDLIINANFSSGATTISFIPNILINYNKLEAGKLHDLVLQRTEHNRVTEEIRAQTGRLVYDKQTHVLTFELENCSILHLQRKNDSSAKKEDREERFLCKEISLPIQLDEKVEEIPDRAKYKTFSELPAGIARYKKKLDDLERQTSSQGKTENQREQWEFLRNRYMSHCMEWYRRIASSLAPFLIVFFGAPLGILIKHNNRLVSFGVGAVPVMLIYYPLQIWGRAMGEKTVLSPFWGECMASIVTISLGIVMLIWVYRK